MNMNPIGRDLGIARWMVIALCLLLSSCTKHQSLQQKNSIEEPLINNKNNILDTIIQQEAMLVDIPIPLYDERIIPSFDHTIASDTLTFGYVCPLSFTQAVDFFMNQMERYGWKHLVTFEGKDLLLQFASPDRYCTIIIKNTVTPSSTRIFIYIKKGELVSSP